MCMSPSAAGTASTTPANRSRCDRYHPCMCDATTPTCADSFVCTAGWTMKPASANSGAAIMQKPAIVFLKWWASEIPNIRASFYLARGGPGYPHAGVKGIYTPMCGSLRALGERGDDRLVEALAVAALGAG